MFRGKNQIISKRNLFSEKRNLPADGVAPRGKLSLFVKLAIVRQIRFRDDPKDVAPVNHHRTVEELGIESERCAYKQDRREIRRLFYQVQQGFAAGLQQAHPDGKDPHWNRRKCPTRETERSPLLISEARRARPRVRSALCTGSRTPQRGNANRRANESMRINGLKGTPRHSAKNSDRRAMKQLKVATRRQARIITFPHKIDLLENFGMQCRPATAASSNHPRHAYAHGGDEIRLPGMGYNIFYIIGVIVVIAVILKFIGLY